MRRHSVYRDPEMEAWFRSGWNPEFQPDAPELEDQNNRAGRDCQVRGCGGRLPRNGCALALRPDTCTAREANR